ncbi:alpha/beta hydrolase fold domain-containing protein [Verrucomicrobia bacterium]|jgi:acetyl esterase|nr:alpha/beta hydrolase fold domain-containing protein [Verrucomicrobiota bacterium]
MNAELTATMKHFVSKTGRRWISLTSIAVLSVLFQGRGFSAEPEQGNQNPDRVEVYKTIGDVSLRMHIFDETPDSTTDRPAIVFFFGGGWVGGNPKQFFPHCRYLAERGMVAMSAEYRVRNPHKTTPFDCVMDGKSAVRWVRSNAERLKIDMKRIAAGGGSAGGHVAAATATVPGLDDDRGSSVSPVPNALVLFNPVYDNGPDGYGYDRVKDRYFEISPMHNIQEGMAPAIVFLGTKDKLIPVATGERFKRRMFEVGARSELILIEEQGHGFFNHGRNENRFYNETVAHMDRFLVSLGYLEQR